MNSIEKKINFDQTKQLNKTVPILSKLLNISYSLLKEKGMISLFIGECVDLDNIGKYLYMLCSEKTLEDDTHLISHKWYKEKYDSIYFDKDYIIYKFSIPELEQKTIIRHFLNGDYSLIDREYVFKNFPEKNGNSENINYAILTKSDSYRDKLEDILNCNIPKNNELLDKPDYYSEVLGFRYLLTEEDKKHLRILKESEDYLLTKKINLDVINVKSI